MSRSKVKVTGDKKKPEKVPHFVLESSSEARSSACSTPVGKSVHAAQLLSYLYYYVM